MKRLILLTCALALSACTGATGTTGGIDGAGTVAAEAGVAVEQVRAEYFATKPMVDLLASLLPPAYAARVAAAQAIVERALEAARVATTAAEQLIELRKARAAARDIETLTGV